MTKTAEPVETVETKQVPPPETALATQRSMTPGQMATVLIEKADFDVEKLSKLMELQDRHEAKVAKQAFAQAMVMFRSKVGPIIQTGHRDDTKTRKTDGTFGTVKYDYAELTSTIDQIQDLLMNQCQIVPTWRMVKNDPNWVELECILTHIMGHSETSLPLGSPPLDASRGMNPVQRRTGAITMLKRATLFMVLGLVTKDDDKDLRNGERGTEDKTSKAQKDIEKGPAVLAAKEEFVKLCRQKSGEVRMPMPLITKAYEATVAALGADDAVQCLEYLKREDVTVGKDGKVTGPRMAPVAEGPAEDLADNVTPEQLAEEQPAETNFVCSRCKTEFKVMPANGKCTKCLGAVTEIVPGKI